MAAADYRLMTEATGQRIAAALEALSGTGAAAAAARTNLDVYSKGETDTAIAQSTAITESGDFAIVTAPEGASLYGNYNFYRRQGKIVFISFGFKLENATVGSRYDITTDIPLTCKPSRSASTVATNGTTTGAVNLNFNNRTFTVYADKAGTTYAIGSLMYLIS